MDASHEISELKRRISQLESFFTATESAAEQAKEDVTTATDSAITEMSYVLLTSTRSIDGIANIILNYSLTLTQSKHGYVSMIDPETCHNVCLTLTTMIGNSCRVPENDKGIIFPVGDNGKYPALWGHALNTRKAFFTNIPANLPNSIGTPQGHIPLTNFLSVPVIAEKELLGQISLANTEGLYSDMDLKVIQRIASLYAILLRNERESYLNSKSAPSTKSSRKTAGLQKLLTSTKNIRNSSTKTNLSTESSPSDEPSRSILRSIIENILPHLDKLLETPLNKEQTLSVSLVREGLENILNPLNVDSRMWQVWLTPQEIQIVALIKSGAQTKEISQILGISEHAVHFHRKNIRKKFGLTNKKINLRTFLLSLSENQ